MADRPSAEFTPNDVITAAVIGAAVVGMSFALGRVRRWWERLDPFAGPRERMEHTRIAYRGGRDRVSNMTEITHSLTRLLEGVRDLRLDSSGTDQT